MAEEIAPAKILIVEDEALIAREIQHRLTNMGWEVVGTAFGEEAVEMALDTQPDLLLSDINLRHGLSGIDLAQRIQAVIDIPIVFLTAYSDEDTVARAKTVTPFGYIIKPVENRDLQITIEMALYKFRVEKELREKQQLLETALACIGNALVFLDPEGRVTDINQDAEVLLGGAVIGTKWPTILGDARSVRHVVEAAIAEKNVAKIPPFLLSSGFGSTKLADGIVGPMDEGAVLIIRDLGDIEDPVRFEPDERYASLGVEHLSPSESAFCQLLISPDNVAASQLEDVVVAVRQMLDPSLRSTDLASIFSNSVVSISLPYTEIEEGKKIAESLLEQLTHFEISARPVSFSAGLAFSVGSDQEPIELFRRAGSALDTARRAGGNRLWIHEGDPSIDAIDIQGDRDFRHVLLLWNVMNSIASAGDLHAMCADFSRHLFHVFRAERAALLGVIEGRLSLEAGYTSATEQTDHISDFYFDEAEFEAIRLSARDKVRQQSLDKTIVINLLDHWVLFISGVVFSDEDHRFLETLCAYFTASIARFEVEPEEQVREATSERTLVYESIEMKQVLEAAELAAPTDATVLLTGESGTGKELVARHIHQRSHRSDEPLVVVDCGAVAPSLIESELFGHVKGAFTGATSNFSGRLKEAGGGTVLLDEVGELPLDTQVKLLRFVQERQLAAVGSNKYETVDARVIAATNKDLKEMVAAGTFREDLYYRLNVFSVSVPPLRDRRTDILTLAHHYREIFARRYSKNITGFTKEAEQALVHYRWPGNIRELSNVVNRAVILSKDSLIWPIHLGVFGSGDTANESVATITRARDVLANVVSLGTHGHRPLPVGRYLEEDLILMGIAHHEGVLNRAAISMGVPESTLRRRIQKIEKIYGSTDPDRPEAWPIHTAFYDEVTRLAAAEGKFPLDLLQQLLFREIESRDLNKSVGAQLMGISLPTFRRFSS